MRRVLVLALLLSMGCFPKGPKVVRVLQRLSGAQTGWFAVEPTLTIDEHGGLHLPPVASLDDEDDAPYMERLFRAYQRQFEQVALEAGCGEPRGAGTVYVLVHGIGGAGHEWLPVIPTLARTGPAALYMYKWFGYEQRGVIVRGLVEGVQHLARCNPDSPVVVLGHSAGGVLAAFAASRLELPERVQPVTLITVASPLAGVGARPEIVDPGDHMEFFNDLGTTRRGYPAASKGVTVLHLRTFYPADVVMKPTRAGYAPNALSAVVRGSTLIDLPDTLGHDDALLYTARQLELGRLP